MILQNKFVLRGITAAAAAAEVDTAAAEDTAAAPARKHNIFISFGSSDNLNSTSTLPLSVLIEKNFTW